MRNPAGRSHNRELLPDYITPHVKQLRPSDRRAILSSQIKWALNKVNLGDAFGISWMSKLWAICLPSKLFTSRRYERILTTCWYWKICASSSIMATSYTSVCLSTLRIIPRSVQVILKILTWTTYGIRDLLLSIIRAAAQGLAVSTLSPPE